MDLPVEEGPIRPSNLTGALQACEIFSDALCLFKTEHAVSHDPIDWLQASHDHIVDIIQNFPFFTQEERDECSDFVGKMHIYQNFVAYTYIHLSFCGIDLDTRTLDAFRNLVSEWQSWDRLTSLTNHRSISGHLLDYFRQLRTLFPSTFFSRIDDTLESLVALDINGLCAQLSSILNHTEQYKKLLDTRNKTAQCLLDLLQQLIDYPPLTSELKHPFTVALIRLSKTSGLYSECLVLNNSIQTIGSDPVASGQFGEVWRGRVQGQEVAVKVLKKYETSDIQKLLKDFAREVAIWRQLSHENILPFYGIYHLNNDRSRVCFISPWMQNGNIIQFLRRRPTQNKMPLVLNIAEGLAYLHSLTPRIIHGDLKGVNILVTTSQRACLCDFGLASEADSEALRWTSLTSAPTGGTIRWQAPELLMYEADETESQGHNTTETDIYAFACVCYEIFSGDIPFPDVPHGRLAVMVYQGERPPRPNDPETQLDDHMWDLIRYCWAAHPEDRPSANEIVERLQSRSDLKNIQRPSSGFDQTFVSRLRQTLAENVLAPVQDQDSIEKPVGVPSSDNLAITPWRPPKEESENWNDYWKDADWTRWRRDPFLVIPTSSNSAPHWVSNSQLPSLEELRQELPSWRSWKADARMVPTPPSPWVTLPRGSPGLFGPRSPRESPKVHVVSNLPPPSANLSDTRSSSSSWANWQPLGYIPSPPSPEPTTLDPNVVESPPFSSGSDIPIQAPIPRVAQRSQSFVDPPADSFGLFGPRSPRTTPEDLH